MRVTRTYVDAPLAAGMRLALPDEVAGHLVRVLRLQPGDAFVLFNGDGHDYEARLLAAGKRGAEAEVGAARAIDNESKLRITLVQGLARGEKMDLVLQKATELGVAAFVPVSSDRSEVKLDADRVDKRVAHWRSVVAAACEQSGRARVPTVGVPQSLAAAMRDDWPAARFLLDPEATQAIAGIALPEAACVLAVGPEGGWSPRDREVLRQAGFTGLRLGPRILRTETAGLAAVAALQAHFGDLA